MGNRRFAVVVAILALNVCRLPAQVFVDADSSGDAYTRLRGYGYDYEVPDCRHPVRHIVMEWDRELRKHVFVFTLHRDLDDDRCINTDRQRCEIETDAASPPTMQGRHGETHTYRWKFRLDADFRPSPRFCHIHQIKADSGAPDSGSPIVSITLRAGSPDKLQIIYTAPAGKSGSGILKEMNLGPFRGVWIEAREQATFERHGSYELTLRRVDDDSLLLRIRTDTLDLWRVQAGFNRPKFGIYRSLAAKPYLRDESVRFADFSLAEGTEQSVPAVPELISATAFTSSQVSISWVNVSTDADQLRIDRSLDGVTWRYLATVKSSYRSFLDTGLEASTAYHFRVRAENAMGNSPFLGPITAQTPKTLGKGAQ